MSSAPVIFKRKSTTQQRRQRDASPENVTDASDSPSAIVAKIKKRNKSTARLSFGATDNDEEEDVFQPKKSNLSRQMSKSRTKLVASISAPVSTPQSGPTYDKAYLSELKASTPSARPPPPVASNPYDVDLSLDASIDPSEPMDEVQLETLVPSTNSIKVARDARERMRKSGGGTREEEFISLSLTRQEDIYQGPHPGSRLMREEDDLGDGDDEFAEYTSAQDRIAIGKKARNLEADKRKTTIIELMADADEEDEESREWELEQIRRGALQAADRSSRSSKPKAVYKAASIPPPTPVPTLTSALGRLSQQLAQLSTSHAQNTVSLNSFSQQRDELDSREVELRQMVQRAEDKRAYFASFQEWVQGVASFLDEKYPLLENLEKEHLDLLKERHDIVYNRRQRDDEDDLIVIYGLLPDDMDTGEQEERRSQRTSRHSRRRARTRTKSSNDEEGYSTDSSLHAGDESAYREAITSVHTRISDVLKDVRAEEFKDPNKGRWDSWRKTYSDLYVNAWGGLGVITVWEFWARLELVGWDPIEDSRRSLDSFKWFAGLHEYSRPDGSEDLGPDGDLVASMITTAVIPRLCAVVEGGALDVYSGSHMKRLADLADELEASIEEGSGKFQLLQKAAFNCFEKAVLATEQLVSKFTVSQTTSSFNPQAVPCRQRFLLRRVKLLQNLIKWRKKSGEAFGIGGLAMRMVDHSVVPIAESGWIVGGEILVRQVADILPPELRSLQLKARLNIP